MVSNVLWGGGGGKSSSFARFDQSGDPLRNGLCETRRGRRVHVNCHYLDAPPFREGPHKLRTDPRSHLWVCSPCFLYAARPACHYGDHIF